jgi:hypothetical protein
MAKTENIDWNSLDPEAIDMILKARIADYWKSVEANGGKEPKRAGYLIERIADIDNLRDADRAAQNGKVKKNRFIRRHNEHAEQDLREIQMMILTLDFPPCEYEFMDVVSDAGKLRHIAKQKYHPWRILAHAIMQIVGPYIYRSLIHDTFACIKGKGLHFGVKRMKMMLRRYPEYKWFWKTDFKKFYLSIPHDVMREALRHKFKDERFIELMDIAVFSYESGEEITNELNEELRWKERCAYRRIHKPAARQLRRQRHRPLHEGAAEGEVLPSLLRRCHRQGDDKGGGSQGLGGV